MYTRITNVREVAGFTGNSNVSDAFILRQITRADGMINSYVSDAYALPLPNFYKQTIAFSGTGSGTSTMTITINGTSYTVAVTSGMTAGQAADLFRRAAMNSDDFIVDQLGNGATVYMIARDSGDPTDVTISSTDPQTVAGITATGGSIVEVAPPMVEYLSTEIAAAIVLTTEYGPEAQDTDKDGLKRLAVQVKTLENIKNKVEKLFDYEGVELPASSTKRISFYPTAASEEDEEDPTANRITMNTKF